MKFKLFARYGTVYPKSQKCPNIYKIILESLSSGRLSAENMLSGFKRVNYENIWITIITTQCNLIIVQIVHNNIQLRQKTTYQRYSKCKMKIPIYSQLFYDIEDISDIYDIE
ncbi:Hypothetical_protein [Hexamita inflata]|uniref:Hypothetical_protein n=1 Tax=Hexamita inflata TaxID=28002 RepID=A0AA86U011_9EUKA|nr:Hypothetical protein HINF_LOCUS22649 [Hexamita inflata]